MAESRTKLSPLVKESCDLLVMELVNEHEFYKGIMLLLEDKARPRNKWVSKKLISDLVRQTTYKIKTLTKPTRITPNMMHYIWQQLMDHYKDAMKDIDKERKLSGKICDTVIIDDPFGTYLDEYTKKDIVEQEGAQKDTIDVDCSLGDFSKLEAVLAARLSDDSISVGYKSEQVGDVKVTDCNISISPTSRFRNMGAFYKGPTGRDMYSVVAKETGRDRNKVKSDFYAWMYGSTNGAGITNQTKFKTNGEPQMNKNAKPFENVNYDLIFGQKAEDLSDESLYEAIQTLEDNISSREKIKAESVAKDKSIQEMRDNIAKIVAVLDARIDTTEETK